MRHPIPIVLVLVTNYYLTLVNSIILPTQYQFYVVLCFFKRMLAPNNVPSFVHTRAAWREEEAAFARPVVL